MICQNMPVINFNFTLLFLQNYVEIYGVSQKSLVFRPKVVIKGNGLKKTQMEEAHEGLCFRVIGPLLSRLSLLLTINISLIEPDGPPVVAGGPPPPHHHRHHHHSSSLQLVIMPYISVRIQLGSIRMESFVAGAAYFSCGRGWCVSSYNNDVGVSGSVDSLWDTTAIMAPTPHGTAEWWRFRISNFTTR